MASSNRLPRLQWLFLRVFGLMTAAPLALSARGGGGDSTVQARPTRCRRSKGPPQGIARRFPGLPVCPEPEPVVPVPLAGLGQAAKVAAAPALGEVADRTKVQIIPHGAQHPKSDRFSIMALQLRYPLDKTTTVIGDFIDTKLPEVVPSGNTGNVSYLFELCTPAEDNNRRTISGGFQQLSTEPFEHEIFPLTSTTLERLSPLLQKPGRATEGEKDGT